MSGIVEFFKALAGVCETESLDPRHWHVEGTGLTVNINDVPQLKQPGGAVYLTGQGLPRPVLIVRKPDQGFLCVENRCTHMGRKLDAAPDGQTLRCCSVNHSRFDHEGNKVSGPAKGPVKVYASQEDGGKLLITLA
jgi:cytochrome b6-f complex iron-sulfur subunit